MIVHEIVTERLILRALRKEDSAEVVTIWGDKENGKYLCDPYYESAEQLSELLNDIHESPVYYFAASLKGTEKIMATCSIGPEDDDLSTWGIGYTVRKKHWGNGYACEMVRMLIEFAREHNAQAVIGTVAKENYASNRIMQKCGFQIVQESSFQKSDTDITYPSYIYKLYL
ncbi:MAG: GNAT family N-acetyltransferase [Firmicutes bacterium]|nr:GNAT family N-acetyltransferase [Bacillota bacterium]